MNCVGSQSSLLVQRRTGERPIVKWDVVQEPIGNLRM